MYDGKSWVFVVFFNIRKATDLHRGRELASSFKVDSGYVPTENVDFVFFDIDICILQIAFIMANVGKNITCNFRDVNSVWIYI